MAKRTTVLEAQVGEVKGSVTRVESVISTEIESIAESITQLKAQVNDDIGAALTEESRVRASEDEALSQRITTLTTSTTTEIGKNTTAIQAETTARTNADTALGQRIDTVTASTVTADAKAVAAKAAADAAQGTANTAKTDAATAAGIANSKGKTIIQSTAPAAADRLPQNLWIDTASGKNTPKKWETNKWVAVTDKVAVDAANAAAVADGKAVAAKAAADAAAAVGTTNKAAIQAETTARTNADKALGQRIDTIEASVGDNISAEIEEIRQAQATADGKASAMWGVKLKVNSNGDYVTAGVGLGLENVNGTLQSNFIVEANNFTVINGPNGAKQVPFTVQGDNVVIKSAFIGDATITMAKIGGDLYSTNYIAGVSGWRLKRDGTFEINTTVPGQGRTVINNKGMRVYDAANKIRVKIGDLT